MATTIYPTAPVAQPAAEQWPPNDIGDDDPIGIQADEMFARQLDTGFAGEIRALVHGATPTDRLCEDSRVSILGNYLAHISTANLRL